MRFFAYIYQLKVSFRKFFYFNRVFLSTDEDSRCAKEVDASIKLKCKKSAIEIQYINSFNYWPITEAKTRTELNEIAYLDISRKIRTSTTRKNHNDNKIIDAINKNTLTNLKNTNKKTVPARIR
jgi:hypothetical protein